MGKIFDRHIELVEAVNNAKSEQDKNKASDILYGFREALEAVGINQLMECDMYYVNRGIDRPMCCGVFLD